MGLSEPFLRELNGRTSDYEICPSFADKMGSILSNYRVKMNETDSVCSISGSDVQIVDMTMSTFRDCSHRNCSLALLGCAGAPNSCLIHCTTEDAFVVVFDCLKRIEAAFSFIRVSGNAAIHSIEFGNHQEHSTVCECHPQCKGDRSPRW